VRAPQCSFVNFRWRTREPEEGRNRLPAAMMAGVVDNLWSFEDLYDRVMGYDHLAGKVA
jgi:hypothetical protein